MQAHLTERILRHLEALDDDRGYRVLDYIEFLESKYAGRSAPDNIFTRITERVEDTMRAGKLPVDAISGTVTFFDGASKVMRGLASAAQSVVDEAARVAKGSGEPPAGGSAPTATPGTRPTDGDGASG
jgi:hypothetical protein